MAFLALTWNAESNIQTISILSCRLHVNTEICWKKINLLQNYVFIFFSKYFNMTTQPF